MPLAAVPASVIGLSCLIGLCIHLRKHHVHAPALYFFALLTAIAVVRFLYVTIEAMQ